MPDRATLRTYGLLAGGMAVFGSGTPISKIVTDAFPVFTASGARMALAVIALLPLVAWEHRRGSGKGRMLPRMPRADWLRLGAIAVAGMFLFSVFMLYGMKEVSGTVGGIIMATTPAVTAAGAVLFLGDRLDRWTSLAIGAAVGGVLAVNLGGESGGGAGSLLLGSLLIFGAVCGEASYTLIGKRLTASISAPQIALIAAAMAVVLFAVPAIVQISDLDLASVSAGDWLALMWWGVGTMGIGSLLWYQGVSRVSGATASAFMGVMPISAIALSYLLLGDSFVPLHAVGMAAVLAGIAAVTRGQRSG